MSRCWVRLSPPARRTTRVWPCCTKYTLPLLGLAPHTPPAPTRVGPCPLRDHRRLGGDGHEGGGVGRDGWAAGGGRRQGRGRRQRRGRWQRGGRRQGGRQRQE